MGMPDLTVAVMEEPPTRGRTAVAITQRRFRGRGGEIVTADHGTEDLCQFQGKGQCKKCRTGLYEGKYKSCKYYWEIMGG